MVVGFVRECPPKIPLKHSGFLELVTNLPSHTHNLNEFFCWANQTCHSTWESARFTPMTRLGSLRFQHVFTLSRGVTPAVISGIAVSETRAAFDRDWTSKLGFSPMVVTSGNWGKQTKPGGGSLFCTGLVLWMIICLESYGNYDPDLGISIQWEMYLCDYHTVIIYPIPLLLPLKLANLTVLIWKCLENDCPFPQTNDFHVPPVIFRRNWIQLPSRSLT